MRTKHVETVHSDYSLKVLSVNSLAKEFIVNIFYVCMMYDVIFNKISKRKVYITYINNIFILVKSGKEFETLKYIFKENSVLKIPSWC